MTEPTFKSSAAKLAKLEKMLQALPLRGYVSRQDLLVAIHHLKKKIDDYRSHQKGQRDETAVMPSL